MNSFVIGPFPPPIGGVSAAATNLVRLLQQTHSGDVEVLSTSSRSEREDLNRRKGVRSFFRSLKLLIQLGGTVLSRGRKYDFFHVFTTSDPAFFRDAMAILVLRALGRRVIVHFHSKTEGEFFLHPRRLRLLGWVLSRSSRVFVLSDRHQEFFGRYIDRNKLGVLENFVFNNDFEIGHETLPIKMLYVSRLSDMKGTWDLLKAVRILQKGRTPRGFSITIAGLADTKENERAFHSYIRDRGLNEVVRTPGLVQGEEKKALFANHGVFVFPSKFENSPVTLKEAIQAEMVIIASDIEANRNILERTSSSLFFPAGDSSTLATVMEKVMQEPELYSKLKADASENKKFDERYAMEVLRDFI